MKLKRYALSGIWLGALLLLGGVAASSGQTPQVDNSFRNVFSEQGAPADPEPPGPTEQTGSQFKSGTAFGGWVATRIKDGGGTVIAGSTSEVAGSPGAIVLPEGTPLDVDQITPLTQFTVKLKSARIGRPLVVRQVNFSIGSVIPRPDRKPDGTLLDPEVFADAEFYFKEPANVATAGFYWSPHAEKVFAVQPGVVTVDWEERVSGAIFTQTYTVSGSPAPGQNVRNLYWTEGRFSGPRVSVPTDRVGDIHIAYHNLFPESVAEVDAFDYDPDNPPDPVPPEPEEPSNPPDPPDTLPLELRTLWFSSLDDSIHAYNMEGRVFIELLGDLKEPDRVHREHLGFEIVDVIQEVRPEEVKVAVGAQVFPIEKVAVGGGSLPFSEVELTPEEEALEHEVVAGLNIGDQPYLFEQITNGGTDKNLFAIRSTTPIDIDGPGPLPEQQSNEVLIYWKERGLMDLLWPEKYVGYIFKWPEDYLDHPASEAELAELYSIYARPELAGDAEATGVQLDPQNRPTLVFQDDPSQGHAQLTPQNVFYTNVSGESPNGRSLIQYTNGEEVWFELVYSRINTEFDDYLVTTPANVGERILAPVEADQAVGYLRQTSGTAIDPDAYFDPFVHGFQVAGTGAIIPVNARPADDELEIWWYQKNQPNSESFSATYWPSHVRKYQLQWPAAPAEIVLASNLGSGDLGDASGGSIYRQDDPALMGYNPNEEHALISGETAWALRDDLNAEISSDPYVLVSYTAADELPAMKVFKVLRENGTHAFDYEVPVGVPLQAPMPLPILAPPIDDSGVVANFELDAPTDIPTNFSGNEAGFEDYDSFTFTDRKGSAWIYRGVHDLADEGTKGFIMHYFYKTAGGFDFPSSVDGTNNAPAAGTIVPYLRPFTNGTDASGGFDNHEVTGDSLDIEFTPIWPASSPVLAIGESLALPKHGLPAVRGQTSAEIIYQQSIANDMAVATHSVKLFDPTRAKVHELSEAGVVALNKTFTNDYLGRKYFPNLPPHLSQRFYFDPNLGALGGLVFLGEFVDEAFGEDFLLLNVLNGDDLAALKSLADADANWDNAIDGLSTTMETFIEDPARAGTYIVDESKSVDVGPAGLAEVTDDDTAVDSYAISATGGGTGFVVFASGNGEAFTPEGEPVSLHVFRVAPPLYRGELKIVSSSNPLDEKLTLQHSGDYAGNPDEYEFAWLSEPPAAGAPPTIYTFTALPTPVLGDGNWTLFNNPAADYTGFRAYGADDSISPWLAAGDIASNPIVIDDGGGTPGVHGTSLPQALLRREFNYAGATPFDLYVSLDLGTNDGAAVYLNNAEIAVWNVPGSDDSIETTPPSFNSPGSLSQSFLVAPEALLAGNNVVTVELYTSSDPTSSTNFNVRLHGRTETEDLSGWNNEITAGAKDASTSGETGKSRHTIEGASLLTLSDNYVTMRYRPLPGTEAEQALIESGLTLAEDRWSRWMPPQLAEGFIKRALAGINPFQQRVTDLLNNPVNTDVSLLTQAGARWEGDIALNLENIDDFGLIEIYETIFNRGKDLSIEGAPAFNYTPANDALLLAAGYINDLYTILGNEAFADAANPTIAFDTDGGDFGEFNTALFAFKGQLASVLDEELALMRGRDDLLQPGVGVSPVYNRMVWNFTRGIGAGEVIYSLNYNIQDNNVDGIADAADAAEQYPQGHGDAYGHYLTALKVYYHLLANPNFSWTPRIEAVTVLGQPVAVDYQDERKFAAAAASLARTASQTLDLTYREEFTADETAGWSHLEDGETNPNTGVIRYWGTDEWATRSGQGALFHWVTANSILPAEDSVNEGIEKVDRTTVPELDEVVAQAEAVQLTLDNADARLNPLGLAKGALAFDISPAEIDLGKTHYEQVFERATAALGNAVFAFNNAKDSTEFLRRQENGAADQRAVIDAQEQAFENDLIEIYGTPYPDDIGPGRTYAQGYEGPDLLHFAYVDVPELFFDPTAPTHELDLIMNPSFNTENTEVQGTTVPFSLNAMGEVVKPPSWTGQRSHPGLLQSAVSKVLSRRQALRQSVSLYEGSKATLNEELTLYASVMEARKDSLDSINRFNTEALELENSILASRSLASIFDIDAQLAIELGNSISEGLPTNIGFSNDGTSIARALAKSIAANAAFYLRLGARGAENSASVDEANIRVLERYLERDLSDDKWSIENEQLFQSLRNQLGDLSNMRNAIDIAIRDLDQATRDLQATKARGFAIQRERETFRKRAAAIVQGYRTRDLAFRVFRDESLEKYKVLFDLAARYTFLAARAYDYETGLLDSSGSSAAASFMDGIVQSRALGVVDANGDPQFTASDTGDPGLAGVLAQMSGDWSVAKTRLGFNNPDNYRTTFSLRGEHLRIVPGTAGDLDWKDRLTSYRNPNILDDPDVRRYAMQIDGGDGLPVPGLVIPFQTTIADGVNFFGQPLAGGDHTFSPTSFATKIRSSGIAFDGYIGMDDPTSIGGDVGGSGGSSPPDPDLGHLDPDALSATPYIYLVPVGVDTMRSPPLGDTSTVRSWSVADQAIPLPFNIGNTDFSTNSGFISSESLSEEPFAIRKHQAFRAVPKGTVFSSAPGFTNSRLIGRSAWNSNWKIVIPGKTLRANADVGLDVFIDTVKDIELFLETYSYSGN